jgi:flavin reductase (DIM6/NTAB) family NADH-FMN oxidoreductase RutF
MSVSHRRPVPLSKAHRLLNHGPTVLVSAAHDGQRNIMAAAWAMPLDFEPPKIAVVLDKSTWTRAAGSLRDLRAERSQQPQADIVQTVGSTSGLELTREQGRDKFQIYDLPTFDAELIDAPMLEGCVAWLECRLLPEPDNHQQYDLFLAQVIAAQADERVFSDGRWHFEGQDVAHPAPRRRWALSDHRQPGGWQNLTALSGASYPSHKEIHEEVRQ